MKRVERLLLLLFKLVRLRLTLIRKILAGINTVRNTVKPYQKQ